MDAEEDPGSVGNELAEPAQHPQDPAPEEAAAEEADVEQIAEVATGANREEVLAPDALSGAADVNFAANVVADVVSGVMVEPQTEVMPDEGEVGVVDEYEPLQIEAQEEEGDQYEENVEENVQEYEEDEGNDANQAFFDKDDQDFPLDDDAEYIEEERNYYLDEPSSTLVVAIKSQNWEQGQDVPSQIHKKPYVAPPPALYGHSQDLHAPGTFVGEDDFADESQEKGRGKLGFKSSHPYRARQHDERKIVQDLKKIPPKHEYNGYIYSAESRRPKDLTFYFLPVYKQPAARQHIQICGPPVHPEKLHHEGLRSSCHVPLSSVKLRWKSSRSSTVYKLEDVYACLSRFGPIQGVYAISTNSALVIFCDLEAARAAVLSHDLGLATYPLYASWVEPKMNNISYYTKWANVEESPLRLRS